MKKNILLIEDSQTQLKSITLSLEKYGYNVLSTDNSVEGIKLAYDNMPDLIISDIIMPEINGYQLCRLLKNDKITKNIPIILLTSLNEKLDKFWGLRAGADTFLTKSEDFTVLKTQIDKFIDLNNTFSLTNKEINSNAFESSSIQSRINHLLDQSLIESTIINEFKNLSEFATNTKVFIKGIFFLISSILDYNAAGLFFNDCDTKKKKTLYINTIGLNVNENITDAIKKDFFSTVFFEDINMDDYSVESIDDKDPTISEIKMDEFKSRVVIPIIYEDKILGGICLYDISPNKYNYSKYSPLSRVFNIIVEELKLLMRIKWLYSETRYLAITDGLTGIYNRRYFQQALSREFARAKRYKSQLGLVMFDVDHFKQINDTYGHQFGDKVLAEVATIIKNSFRKTDYVARYGGEEFIAILPETSLSNTCIPVERIRKHVETKEFKFNETTVKITISVGVTNLISDIETEQDFLSRVDKALYKAKENGRNRIELCQEIDGN
jgi:diguanylate cyclase (GGDEF)-like protein